MSRIYENTKEALNEIERDIMEMGIIVHPFTMQNKNVKDDENYSTLELQNYSFTILNTSDAIDHVPNRDWALAEFEERIAKEFTNPGEAYKKRVNIWEEFLNEEGKFDYTYNERINAFDQLNKVIKELKENPDTRQAIIQIHEPKDVDSMRKNRIPCSMYYQLMVRRGQLDIIYNMRSSDFDTHFRNDIFLATALRDYIAKKIGIPSGLFHMNSGSLHRFKNYTKRHIF